jgi:LacI family transcriptional regulator
MSNLSHGTRAGGRLSGARPTMKDVASRAGVALKTVSRVVNGEPGVTPATATRVLDAIEDLGFRRNESARLLRTGRTSALGFISDDLADCDTATLCREIEDVAREHDMLLLCGSTDHEPEREQQLALSLTARRVDGLVVLPAPGDHGYLAAEIEAGTATVFVLRPPAGVEADTVLVDEWGGARSAVAHLIAQGHRRIGFLGSDQKRYRPRQLLAGYEAAMKEVGLTVEESWTTLTPRQLADSLVTAIFCAGREHTSAALRALAAAGARSEAGGAAQVAIVGFGDLELADCVHPGLTVVTYDPAEVGRKAAELLFRRLDGPDGADAPPHRVEVPTRLIPRGSGEIPGPAALRQGHHRQRDHDGHDDDDSREQADARGGRAHVPWRRRFLVSPRGECLEAGGVGAEFLIKFGHGTRHYRVMHAEIGRSRTPGHARRAAGPRGSRTAMAARKAREARCPAFTEPHMYDAPPPRAVYPPSTKFARDSRAPQQAASPARRQPPAGP